MKPNPHLDRLRLLHPVRRRLAAGLAVMAAAVLLQLVFPKALAYFIDNITRLRDAGVSSRMVLAALAVIALHAVASSLRFYLFHSSGLLIVTRLRRRLFDVLINQPIAFFDRHHAAELTSRLTSDVQALHESLTIGAANGLRSLCVLAGAAAMLLQISPPLSVPLALFIPVSLYLGKRSGASYRQRAREAQASLADSGKVAQEHFSNVRLVHAFNQQGGAHAKYVAATQRLLAVSLDGARLLALFQGAQSALMLLTLLTTLCVGAHLIGQGRLSVGGLTAFVIYTSMVTDAAGSVSDFWNSWMRSIGATDRIFAILRAHQPPPPAPARRPLDGRVALQHARFCYPERAQTAALDGISVTIAAGEKVALVGASGAGKSTLASIILGHYQLDAGCLLFDDVAVAALGVANCRSHTAIVEQEPSLFSGTIAENIAFAVPEREVTPAELVAAAELANAHGFISGFPHGYETVVGERGVQLSGGQKQRIAIARAILRDPRILVLDEATSALDSASELLVQRALDTLMEGRTTIIIAHRFSTIVKADRILVMEQGKIRQQGTHAELLRQPDGLYFHLMRHQLSQYSPRAGQVPA